MLRRTCVRTLVLALLGVLVGAQGVSTAELVFRVERVTGDLWAKGWIETSTGFKFPDGSEQTTAAEGNVWSLTGNAISTGDFLGTTNNQALSIRVNNERVLFIEPTGGSPNLVGGYHENYVEVDVIGATIGGGGSGDNGIFALGAGEHRTAGLVLEGPPVNRVTGHFGTVSGGLHNTAGGFGATVGGGEANSASGAWDSTVSGGWRNTASGHGATVVGGSANIASGNQATVGGGSDNTAAGDFSFAAGRRAKANHDGAFVWADSTDADFASGGEDEFNVRATGGFYFFPDPFAKTGVKLEPGGHDWSITSDRELKENFTPVDGRQVLDQLSQVPITQWNLRSQDPSIQHIGPVAQDFYEAFGLGSSDRHITGSDVDGIALVSIQALYELSQEKDAQIAQQAEEIAQLTAENEAFRARLETLEKLVRGGE